MKDFTIVIQGRCTPDALRYYNQHYTDYNVIISTWDKERIIGNKLPIVRSPKPFVQLPQNFNYQLRSTLAGLDKVKTKYVIKLRADEYYSNIPYIVECMKNEPNKVHCSPVFFRKWNAWGYYHISDHIIAGKTSDIKKMYNRAQEDVTNKRTTPISEVNLGSALIREKEVMYTVDKNVFKKHFSILDIDKLGDYKIVANAYSKVWKSGEDPFVPEEWESIRSIEDL